MSVLIRSAFGYDADAVSHASGLECKDVSLAVQADAEDADINTIVRRFGLTGELPQNVRMPLSGDFSSATDYQSSLNALIAADAAFMAFPADVRARFNHKAAEMIAFVEDPANYDEAVKLGIANARPIAPSPAPVEPASPAQ